MQFELTADQQALWTEIDGFARCELTGGAAERDREQRFAHELWRRCGTQRLQGAFIPEALGGRGLSPLDSAVALEALGHGCDDNGLIFSLGAHLCTVSLPMWKFGSAAQQERWMRGLCDGTLVGVGALTEPDTGSDAFGSMRTIARRDGDDWVIDGEKHFITNAAVADVVIVYAATDAAKGFHGGVTAFVVARDTPGLHIGSSFEKMGLRSSPFGRVVCDGLRVAPESVLGHVGGGSHVFTLTMDWERVLIMASHVGTMQRLLERSVRYARTTKRDGEAIGKSQGVSHRLADMKVRLEAARLLIYRAASRLDRVRTVSLDSAVAKLFAGDAYQQATLDAFRTHGDLAMSEGDDLARMVRDAAAAPIYSGTSNIQRNIIARWLGL